MFFYAADQRLNVIWATLALNDLAVIVRNFLRIKDMDTKIEAKTVTRQIKLDGDCKGVTSLAGKHHTANERGEVEIPATTARMLEFSGAVGRPSKSFGQMGASWQPESKLNIRQGS